MMQLQLQRLHESTTCKLSWHQRRQSAGHKAVQTPSCSVAFPQPFVEHLCTCTHTCFHNMVALHLSFIILSEIGLNATGGGECGYSHAF